MNCTQPNVLHFRVQGDSEANCTVPGEDESHTILLVIYSVVLLCGTVSLSLTVYILKSHTTSSTSVAVLNLIFAHFIFLITVPFRIYYYATHRWYLDFEWCKIVSAMIHVHMYMSFMLYVVILVTRLLPYYYRGARVTSFSSMHALIASVLVWIIVLVTVLLVIRFVYAKDDKICPQVCQHCFRFAHCMASVKGLNYFLSTLIILVTVVLTVLQANVLLVLYRKYRAKCSSQQDFEAQLKSLLFALIMFFCNVPYHMFRLYYIEHSDLENINEVLLGLTTLNCLDMLTFLGRRTCIMCFPGSGR
ncbi:probable G-protein coupled receptor 141 [Nothobranchius furzeri]|uniref:G protein-coupled receptor 141 n=1 Tax=Nothobranchius furzeri TaxID=105023 RepID=A0A9D2Y4J3_NOTFU|nr:G protein-coupled receptor 141 [Nothobranchius furzeri]